MYDIVMTVNSHPVTEVLSAVLMLYCRIIRSALCFMMGTIYSVYLHQVRNYACMC